MAHQHLHTSTLLQFTPVTGFEAIGELVGVIQRLGVSRSLEDIQVIVRRAARRLTGADGATFVLRDGDACFYADEDAIAPLWKGQRFPIESCVSGWAMQHREVVVIPDIYTDSRVPHDAYRPTFVKSMCMVPIRALDPVGAIGTSGRFRTTSARPRSCSCEHSPTRRQPPSSRCDS